MTGFAEPLATVTESIDDLSRERLQSSWMIQPAPADVFARNRECLSRFLIETRECLGQADRRNIPAESDRFALFVGWRRDPRLEYVFRNVMHFLGPEWGLQVIAWPDVMADIQCFSHGWSHVHYTQVADVEQSESSYHAILSRPPFWERARGDCILLFDADTLLASHDVSDFLNYDYVGSPWAKGESYSPMIRIGDGGFSLRHRQTMLDICSSNRRLNVIKREDVFFTLHLHLDPGRYKVADLEAGKRFAVEGVYSESPLGLHRPWECLATDELDSLLRRIRYHGD